MKQNKCKWAIQIESKKVNEIVDYIDNNIWNVDYIQYDSSKGKLFIVSTFEAKNFIIKSLELKKINGRLWAA